MATPCCDGKLVFTRFRAPHCSLFQNSRTIYLQSPLALLNLNLKFPES